jgi:cytochrome c oxidase assembly protein subunit 11
MNSVDERPAASTARHSNRALVVRLGVVVVAMFAFGYALVPFYDQICKATGLRDIAVADKVENSQVDATRTVRLEFDANLNKLPWRFRPLTPVVNVHPGELTQVLYEIENQQPADDGQAVPSYGPQRAGGVFPQARLLLLFQQTSARRKAPDAGCVRHRLPAARRRHHDHAFLHILRSRRQPGAGAELPSPEPAGATRS